VNYTLPVALVITALAINVMIMVIGLGMLVLCCTRRSIQGEEGRKSVEDVDSEDAHHRRNLIR
jgi:multisubunit Na+/H+ antiporter MnhC subunit